MIYCMYMEIYGLNIVGNLFPWGQILRGPAICSVKDTSENEQAVERERACYKHCFRKRGRVE